MPNKKRRFTFDEHNKLAHELQTMRDRLQNIRVELSKAYPFKISDNVAKPVDALDDLRILLEMELYKEFPDKKHEELTFVYFRSGRKDHTHNPKPIYPLREVSKD